MLCGPKQTGSFYSCFLLIVFNVYNSLAEAVRVFVCVYECDCAESRYATTKKAHTTSIAFVFHLRANRLSLELLLCAIAVKACFFPRSRITLWLSHNRNWNPYTLIMCELVVAIIFGVSVVWLVVCRVMSAAGTAPIQRTSIFFFSVRSERTSSLCIIWCSFTNAWSAQWAELVTILSDHCMRRIAWSNSDNVDVPLVQRACEPTRIVHDRWVLAEQ